MTVAARVAEETGSTLGQAVGYGIRFEDVSTPVRSSTYVRTDGLESEGHLATSTKPLLRYLRASKDDRETASNVDGRWSYMLVCMWAGIDAD